MLLNGNEWTDSDFGYDRERDLVEDRCHIRRPDGATLYNVCEWKEGAKFTVHFCSKAQQIWAVGVEALKYHIAFDENWQIIYSPPRKPGLVSARGYLIPCWRAREFGYCWPMPELMVRQFEACKRKDETGKLAERAFLNLVNERFFLSYFVTPVRKSGQQDDRFGGIDFWCRNDLPVQVKYDGPGGTANGSSGRLFFQTHTLPMSRQQEWHEYEYGS